MSGILHTKDYKHFQIIGETTTAFDDAKTAAKALPGDMLVDGTVFKRAKHTNIVGVLELSSKYRYGFNARSIPIYLFTPYNESYPSFLVASSERDKSVNRIALVDFMDWDDTTFPRGAITRVFGPVGDRTAELDALYWRYSPYAVYPARIEAAIVELPPPADREIIDWSWSANIDPPGCKDADDVISIEPDGDGYTVAISIADVAEYVKPGSEIDRIAALSAQTLYQDGRQPRNMLPGRLCEDIASLMPGKAKLAVSLIFNWSVEKGQCDLRWAKTVLTNRITHTYESIYSDAYAAVLHAISTSLRAALGLQRPASADSHDWIEAVMVFYNVEAAKKLVAAGAGGILRRHAAADVKMLEALPADAAFLAYAAATYVAVGEADVAHWGLSQQLYCHASSPLRRYADIVNQRVLKGEPGVAACDINWLNQRQHSAKAHDRDYALVNICLRAAVGTMTAVVIDVTDKGIKVYSPEWRQVFKIIGDTSNIGTYVNVEYFCNMMQRCWKRRIVFRIKTAD